MPQLSSSKVTNFSTIIENVRKIVKNQLLPAWFKRMDYDYVKFLRMFDLVYDSALLITKVVIALFE